MSWQRRNKPRARQGKKLPPALRNKIIRRDRRNGAACYFMFTDICIGIHGPVEIHHIREVEDGGDDSEENLVCACPPCHTRWSARQSQKRAVKAATEYKRRPEPHPGVLP